MSLQLLLLKPENLPWAYQNRINFSGVYCLFCKVQTKQKTKRFKNLRQLYYHIRLKHKDEQGVDFVISLLHYLSFSLTLRIIK